MEIIYILRAKIANYVNDALFYAIRIKVSKHASNWFFTESNQIQKVHGILQYFAMKLCYAVNTWDGWAE